MWRDILPRSSSTNNPRCSAKRCSKHNRVQILFAYTSCESEKHITQSYKPATWSPISICFTINISWFIRYSSRPPMRTTSMLSVVLPWSIFITVVVFFAEIIRGQGCRRISSGSHVGLWRYMREQARKGKSESAQAHLDARKASGAYRICFLAQFVNQRNVVG